ncbi:DUF916 and DUF3324 domain-containing protein [Carnobacterium gallinarum]|uniref:DUF916 and DUF3324 domain-containing protein n=1 Tax=Carnobacterium gallinarum TaxID=2749 RepID=UPI000553B07A|nr:DUF916 and DUF3324 domain-containing protein [Carnobacterium gallinarum]
MKHIIKGVFLLGISSCFFGIAPQVSLAHEMNFAVKAILPENQRNKEQSYFDLRMTAGQEQVLQVELQNETDQDIIVETTANTATTNDNGIADYTNSTSKKDSSLAFSFAEIATVPKETVVPKKSTQTLEVTLKMPTKEFDGYLLGGLYFKEKDTTEKNAESKDSVAIENKFAYTIGVLLSETDQDIKPKLALNDVKPSQKVGHNVVLLNIQNQNPAMVQKMRVEAKVYAADKKEVLYAKQQDNLKMAPNSNFNYSIPLDDQAFKPGNYQVELTANDGYRDWKMSKDFVVKSDVADKYNKTSLDVQAKPRDYSWFFLGGGVVLIIAVGSFAYWSGRRSQKIR